jgi:hypothetical protein
MTARDQKDKAESRRLLRSRGMVRSNSGEYRERIIKLHNERPIRLARERRLDGQPRRISTKRGWEGQKYEVTHKRKKRTPLCQRITRKLNSLFRVRGHMGG